MNAIVGARTGYAYPQAVISARDVEYRLDSRLLIADPPHPELDEPGDCASCKGPAAYVWRGDRLEPVGSGSHHHLSTAW